MYKQITTDKEFTCRGETIKPVATLEDEDGYKCHICVDDHRFVIRFQDKVIGGENWWSYSNWIFPEVFEALKTLSSDLLK